MREFKKSELAEFKGTDGQPKYIAYNGKVYDVSGSWHWKDGKHQVIHKAGQDLTGALDAAPHGEDLLLRIPLLGQLVAD